MVIIIFVCLVLRGFLRWGRKNIVFELVKVLIEKPDTVSFFSKNNFAFPGGVLLYSSKNSYMDVVNLI